MSRTKVGVVVIGRNEGERLNRCIESLRGVAVVYVDSGSTDGSAHWARQAGVELVQLDMNTPFTAGRARNSGFQKLIKSVPTIGYVQFVDGDCEMIDGWLTSAARVLDEDTNIGIVAGRLRERYPLQSIYNWLCSREWEGQPGNVRSCGGIAMVRASAFASVGGFRSDIIAGEEPELCVRLRAAGWRIWRVDADMALHDAAMTRFSQWWRRTVRSGYAFALGAHLHGAPPERHFVWESRRAWLWGIWLPLFCAASVLIFWPWGWLAWTIYPLQLLRQTTRNTGKFGERALLALFQILGRFPEAIGQLKFLRDHWLRRQAQLIEYK